MGLLRTRVTALTKDGHTMQQQQQYPHYYHYFLLLLLLDQRPKTCSDLIASIERERERERESLLIRIDKRAPVFAMHTVGQGLSLFFSSLFFFFFFF